jgi:hypothetical protein
MKKAEHWTAVLRGVKVDADLLQHADKYHSRRRMNRGTVSSLRKTEKAIGIALGSREWRSRKYNAGA